VLFDAILDRISPVPDCAEMGVELYWIGAMATTTVAIATCTSGVFTAGRAGAIVAAAYTWDQYYREPSCGPCRNPFGMRVGDLWFRERNTQ